MFVACKVGNGKRFSFGRNRFNVGMAGRAVSAHKMFVLLSKAFTPFVVADIVRVFVIAAFPLLAMYLPNLFFK